MASRQAGKQLLQLWMFNGKTRASRVGLLAQAKHILKSGQVEVPSWYQPMKEAPPLPRVAPNMTRPPVIEFPEDKLVAEYLRRNPDAQAIPIDLTSDEPHVALKFAWRQLELMQQGMGKEQAYEQVKARRPVYRRPGRHDSDVAQEEMASTIGEALADVVSKGGSRTPKSSQSVLGLLQAQEEVVLQTKGVLKDGGANNAVITRKTTGTRRPAAALGSSQ